MNFIKIPKIDEINKSSLFNNCGSIDGTIHKRNRQHPGSYEYFRFDKQCSFIGSQIWTSPMAEIYNFTFSKGHNNHQGVYNRSFIKSFLSANNLTLLADGAYSDSSLITPRKPNQKRLDNEQKQERSFVEIVIGYVKN